MVFYPLMISLFLKKPKSHHPFLNGHVFSNSSLFLNLEPPQLIFKLDSPNWTWCSLLLKSQPQAERKITSCISHMYHCIQESLQQYPTVNQHLISIQTNSFWRAAAIADPKKDFPVWRTPGVPGVSCYPFPQAGKTKLSKQKLSKCHDLRMQAGILV